MCGRYAASKSADSLVEEYEVDETPSAPLPPDFNVAPTKPVYAVLERLTDGAGSEVHRRLAVVRWGLVPSWAKDPTIGSRMINARAETVSEKPSYRAAFARRRCVLPADGYFEWQEGDENSPRGKSGKPLKAPWFIHPTDGRSLSMAGLYEIWRDRTRDDDDPAALLWTATVLTTEAEDEVGRIHERAPLVVPDDLLGEWLDPEVTDGASILAQFPAATPGGGAPGRLLEAYRVSTAVNSVRNNGPELIERVGSEVEPGNESSTEERWTLL